VAVDIVRNPEISESARLLYVVMTTYADTGGRDGFTGRRALAQDMGKSMNTISRLLKELEKAGVITRQERRQTLPSGKARRTTDEWALLDEEQTSRARRSAASTYGLEAAAEINDARMADGRDRFAGHLNEQQYLDPLPTDREGYSPPVKRGTPHG
jgi:DNA-binding HxlR family transcriptional regulator